MHIALGIVFTLLVLSSGCIVKYDSSVAQQIFQQNEIYLLLVKMQASSVQQQQQYFDWCSLSFSTALSYPNSKLHSSLIHFIGYKDSSFFAIIDSANKKKYLLPFHSIQSINLAQELTSFYESFQKSILVPYYASEPLPSQTFNAQYVHNLVGTNYQSFLIKQEPIKIVYLHTTDAMCTFCSHLMRQFRQISKKESEEGIIVFGAIDVVKNDNPYIVDEIFPYFLIYVGDNLEDPYGVDAQEFKQMQMYIKQLKKDYKKASKIDQTNDDSQDL